MRSNLSLTRLRLLFWLLIILAVVIIIRLYIVQVIDGYKYAEKAEQQYTQQGEAVFDRGNIYFTDKDGTLISAATLKSGYTISLNPTKAENPEDIFNLLAPILDLDTERFYAKVARSHSQYEKLAERVSEDVTKEIESYDLSGVEIQKEKWRYYPNTETGSRVIGFVGYDGDSLVGRYGLEKYYNETLSRSHVNLFTNPFARLVKSVSTDAVPEGDIITTLEPTVMVELERELVKIDEKYDAKLTGGIIMDPKTGEIIAMSVLPNFDPNNYGKEKDIAVFGNPLVEGIYELGSIMKPLTVAYGLDAGAITAKSTYDDKGSMTLDRSTFYNYDHKARGVVSMQEVLNQSLNTGVAYIVNKMGKSHFADYVRKSGLGEETGIDLPGETHGRLDNLTSPRDIEYATASFGQGIAVTPIAMVQALAVLGNGGLLIRPHVVSKIDYTSGLSKQIDYTNEGERVIKKETSDEISRMLTEVVDKALAKGTMKLEHYSVAAKTGTAQIANPEDGGYYSDRYLHSFFGYFPSYNPRFLVFLYTVEPQGVNYASETLAAPFHTLTKFLINYYNIEPDR